MTCHIDSNDGTGACRPIHYINSNPNPLRVCRNSCDRNCVSTYFCFSNKNKYVAIVNK